MSVRGMLISVLRSLLGIKAPGQMAKDAVMKGKESDKAVSGVGTTVVDGVALTAVGTGITSMVLTKGILFDASAGMTAAFGPVTSYQKRQLDGLGTMRGETNRLRGMVNDLNDENDKLTESVDRLEASVSGLEDVEKNLAKIANTENVDRLVSVVKEYKEVTKKIKANLEARVIQDIMTVVVRADRDGDFLIGPREMKMLMYRLHHIGGVTFNEEQFKKMLGLDGEDANEKEFRLGKIMGVMRNLLDDDVPDSENVFAIDTNDAMAAA